MTRIQALLVTTLACAAAVPAAAQDHPLFHPSHDVMVEYHVVNTRPGDHRSDTVRMYFTDGGMKIRMEPVGQPGYSIIDRHANLMLMVMVPQHIYVEMTYDPKRIMAFDETDATLTRSGSDTVAGIGCTVYDAERQGHRGLLCISSDGLLLRARSNDPGAPNGGMEATSVTYGPQPASLFVPPPGFQRIDPAAMGHGMPPPSSR